MHHSTISPERLQIMEILWFRFFERLGVRGTDSYPVFDQLVAAYTGPTRYYHNLQHINEMLKIAGKLSSVANNLTAVQLAIWFHDSVYDPKSNENEQKSANLASEVLHRFGLDNELVMKVHQLILATASPTMLVIDPDVAVLLDADLAILGAEEARYRTYAAAIRQEYSWVPEADFAQGRLKILQQFLASPQIYRTAIMRELGEAPARTNLMWECEQLIH
ncbi:MAG: hypothetical protein R3B84_12630 [Zavarzinella sp.]